MIKGCIFVVPKEAGVIEELVRGFGYFFKIIFKNIWTGD